MRDTNNAPFEPIPFRVEDITRPEVMAFFKYWEERSGDRFAPSWKEFDLMALDPKSVPYVVVADVVSDPLDFIIRFWGTAHVSRKGVDKTGRSVGATPAFRGRTPFHEYTWVMNQKQPLLARDIINLHEFGGMLDFEQEILRLPLSDDGQDVHHVVSLASWDKV